MDGMMTASFERLELLAMVADLYHIDQRSQAGDRPAVWAIHDRPSRAC